MFNSSGFFNRYRQGNKEDLAPLILEGQNDFQAVLACNRLARGKRIENIEFKLGISAQQAQFEDTSRFLWTQLNLGAEDLADLFGDAGHSCWTDRSTDRSLELTLAQFYVPILKAVKNIRQRLLRLQDVLQSPKDSSKNQDYEEKRVASTQASSKSGLVKSGSTAMLMQELNDNNDLYRVLIHQAVAEGSSTMSKPVSAPVDCDGESWDESTSRRMKDFQDLFEVLLWVFPNKYQSYHTISISPRSGITEGVGNISCELVMLDPVTGIPTQFIVEVKTMQGMPPLARQYQRAPSYSQTRIGPDTGPFCLRGNQNRSFDFRPTLRTESHVQSHGSYSLDDILTQKKSHEINLPVQYRLRVAVSVAKVVLHLHDTSWVHGEWGSKDILFYGSIDAHDVYRVSEIFVGIRSLRSESSPTSQSPLFFLGVVLLELGFSAPLRTLQLEEDVTEGFPEWKRQYLTLLRLSETVSRCLGSNFAKVVDSCLSEIHQLQRYHDYRPIKINHEKYTDIVSRLEKCLSELTFEFEEVKDTTQLAQEMYGHPDQRVHGDMSQCDPLDHIKEYFWRNPGYDFVEESDLNRSNDTSLPGAIAFDECSTLFQSDTVVCAAIHGQDCAARFQRGFYVRPKHDNAYHLDCTVISKDGDIFHHKKVAFEIPEFEGTKLINELPVHPLDYHSDVEGIKRFLHERGKAILKLNGTRHKEYEGVAIEQSPTGPTEHHIQGRIVLDSKSWNHDFQNQVFGDNLDIPPGWREDSSHGSSSHYGMCKLDGSDDQNASHTWTDSDICDEYANDRSKLTSLDAEDLPLCDPWLGGYLEHDQKRMLFCVNYLVDVIHSQQSSAMIKDLSYPTTEDRRDSIEFPHDDTFQWIFKDPGPGFVSWLRGCESIFWVSGKAGSGKSTLMKHILHDKRTVEHMSRSSDAFNPCVVSFYIPNQDSQIGHSSIRLLRSLLIQILEQAPKEVLKTVSRKIETRDVAWSMDQLCAILEEIVQEGLLHADVYIFIDALDEVDENCVMIVDLLENLAKKSKSRQVKIRACISSRPLPVLEHRLRGYPSLTLQDLTAEDIGVYVSSKMATYEIARYYSEEVVMQAYGVFLWVKLVVRSLQEGSINGDTHRELESRLTELPCDLESLYTRILEKIDIKHRTQGERLLWVICENTNMRLSSLIETIEGTEAAALTAHQNTHVDEMQRKCEMMEKRLRSRCGGLLEVFYEHNGYSKCHRLCYHRARVRLLHRTVTEFMRTKWPWECSWPHKSTLPTISHQVEQIEKVDR